MTRQHSSYSQLSDDCSSSIYSTSSNSSSTPLISQPNTSTSTSISTTATNKPKVTIQLRNIAATPLLTSPTRANVLESLVPLSVSNVMPRIITSPKDSVLTSPTSTSAPGGMDEGKEGQKSAKN